MLLCRFTLSLSRLPCYKESKGEKSLGTWLRFTCFSENHGKHGCSARRHAVHPFNRQKYSLSIFITDFYLATLHYKLPFQSKAD